MFITVLAIICLNVAVPGTCMIEPVVNSNQEQVTMGGCLGLLGFESAKEFWEHHPLYHSWKFKGLGLPVWQSRSARARQGLVGDPPHLLRASNRSSRPGCEPKGRRQWQPR